MMIHMANHENIPITKIIANIFSSISPHILSHHPHCVKYKNDVFHIGKSRICRGCFITYPTAIAIIFYSFFTGIYEIYPWYSFLTIGVFLGLFEFFSLWGMLMKFRDIIKFLLGLGVGLVIVGIFSMPVGLCQSFLIFFVLFILAGLFHRKRIVKVEKKCLECQYKKDWDNCPGFRDMVNRLRDKGTL